MKTRILVSCVVPCLVLTVLAGCARKAAPEPPAATVSLSLGHARIPLGSPVEMKYRFVPARGAKIDADYTVFVHFLEGGSREMMWTDDHQPPVPTSRWQAGSPVEYTRTMFTPVYPYVGQATVEIGLYAGKGKRLTLTGGADKGHQAYELARFELLPQTENIFLIYKDGWYPTEVAADNPTLEWQWTKRDATVAFRNPKRSVLFILHAEGVPAVLGQTQNVNIRVGDQTVATFEMKGEVLKKIPVTAAQLGTGEMAEIRIGVDNTFVPSLVPVLKNLNDTRELGLRVFHAFVEAQ